MPKFNRDDIKIHWESGGDGEPLALLNGILMTTQSWKLQTRALEQHYQCLLHDFRGQLLSSKPRTPWTLEDHAEDFRALLDYLQIESCHVVGTSYGGEVGMIFASRWPERVRSLTVISSVSEIGDDVSRHVSEWRQAAATAPESLYRTMLPTTFSEQFVSENPRLVIQGEERLNGLDPDFFTAFVGLIDAFNQLDITPLLGKIRCPALVMVGENDLLKPPRYSRLIAQGIDGAKLHIVPGAGHAVVLEQANVVNAALLKHLERSARAWATRA